MIKTLTFDESMEDDFMREKEFLSTDKISSQQNIIPQFKQLEPLKMIKRDLSKDFLPSSSSTSSADTIVNTRINEKRIGSYESLHV
jgi:hypothetical protein